MKIFAKSKIFKKIIVAIILIIVLSSSVATPRAYAGLAEDGMSTIVKELDQLLVFFIDSLYGALNYCMLGVDWDDLMLADNDHNLDPDSGSWLAVTDAELSKAEKNGTVEEYKNDDIDGSLFGAKTDIIPNILYSPENIFANKIAALDVNFLRPNTYQSVKVGSNKDAEEKAQSSAKVLSKTIATWYRAFRNIAIVGLLSVLIYLGIRILVSSTAPDKAKYKEMLKDWLVALCLVFIIQFIMSFVLMLTDRVNDLFSSTINDGIIIKIDTGVRFKTNLVGYIRWQINSDNARKCVAYTILYIAIIIYTVMFTFTYMKRFLYMAFYTMIAPLVALTYPIDKVGDGKAQAFNFWFKEYTMNAIIQPIHLILYTVFVTSAISLAKTNIIYATVVLVFLLPVEKLIKKMFGVDRSETAGSMGSFAGGALAMQAMQKLMGGGRPPRKLGKGGNEGGSNNESDSGNNDKIDFAKDPTPDASEVDVDALQNLKGNGKKNGKNSSGSSGKGGANVVGANAAPNTTGSFNGTLGNSKGNPNPSVGTSGGKNGKRALKFKRGSKIGGMAHVASKRFKKLKGKKGQMKLKKGAVALAKHSARTFGMFGGALIGMGAGIATGDPKNILKYAGLGVASGYQFGNKAAGAVEGAIDKGSQLYNSANDKMEQLRFDMDEGMYDHKTAKQNQIKRQNKKATKAFLNNEEEQEKYKTMMDDLGYEGDYTKAMQLAADMKTENPDISDDMIKGMLKNEMAYDDGEIGGDSHKALKQATLYAAKNGLDKKDLSDENQVKSMNTVLEGKYGKDGAAQVGQTIADIMGQGKEYAQVNKNLNKGSQKKKTTRKTHSHNGNGKKGKKSKKRKK